MGHFFKDLKATKTEQGQGLSKKAQEMKIFHATALKSAPGYHHHRRLYLTVLLEHYFSLLSDAPEILAPKLIHVTSLLSLCRYEIQWLVRHQMNLPVKKQEINIVQVW